MLDFFLDCVYSSNLVTPPPVHNAAMYERRLKQFGKAFQPCALEITGRDTMKISGRCFRYTECKSQHTHVSLRIIHPTAGSNLHRSLIPFDDDNEPITTNNTIIPKGPIIASADNAGGYFFQHPDKDMPESDIYRLAKKQFESLYRELKLG
jgi:hypothetical protein